MNEHARSLPALALMAVLFGIGAVNAQRPMPPRLSPPTTLRALYGSKPPARLSAAHTALLLVDFQQEFFTGRLALPDAPAALGHAALLLRWAREHDVRVVHVRQVAAKPDSPLFAPGAPTTAFVPALEPRPGETIVTKSMLGAFTRTSLHEQLQAQGVDTLVIAGLMTHLAVQVSAFDATALGYRAIVVADAVATRSLPIAPDAPGARRVDASELQRATLAGLADRAADVLDTESVVKLSLSH